MERIRTRLWLASLILWAACPLLHGISVDQLIEDLQQASANIHDYQCRIAEWSLSGSREESRIVNFYFRQPRHMRMDIILGNRFGDIGSRSVYRLDGTVIGKMGIALMRMPMIVPQDHWAATTVRGKSFEDTDILGILGALVRHRPYSDMRAYETQGKVFVVVDFGDPELSGGLTSETVSFDAATMLPLQNDGYEGGTHVQHIVFSKYIVNAGLPSEVFDVRNTSADIAALDIPTIAAVPIGEDDIAESRYTGR